MADVLDLGNVPIQWEEARRRGAPVNCERAFNALILNLKGVPEIRLPNAVQDMFLEDINSSHVWHYRLVASQTSERWVPFMNLQEPVRAFKVVGSVLKSIAL